MKRDMDLVRALLKQVGAKPPGEALRSPKVEGYDQATVFDHLELMSNEGLISARFLRGDDEISSVAVEGLTWQGHELLSAASNDSVWQKAKVKMADFGGNMSFPVIQALLTELIKQQIGL